jgi:hypothetical protein
VIRLRQRTLYRPPEHPAGFRRGDCCAACVASLFELPYEACSVIDGTWQSLIRWSRTRYPALVIRQRMLGPSPRGAQSIHSCRSWPTRHEPDYWLAWIWRPRIPDVRQRLGIDWGLHAVVMQDARLAWDPHPAARPGAAMSFHSA